VRPAVYVPDGDASLVAVESVERSLLVRSQLNVGKLRAPTQQRQLPQDSHTIESNILHITLIDIILNERLRYDGSRPGVQSASLYDNFHKPGNYVIMTSLMTS